MTTSLRAFTRRALGRICTAALLWGRRKLQATPAERLTWMAQPDPATGSERRYHADAQILLFSIPVLSRKGVGDGSSIWRESAAPDGTIVRLLEFSGRSAPERSAGLNRFGFIQELSRGLDQQGTEAIYFGLMTSSPEESAADARKALHSNAKDVWYSAVEGHIVSDSVQTVSARFLGPARTSPTERSGLIDRARQALSDGPKSQHALPAAASAPKPFLHALADLLKPVGPSETRYAYNGRMYRLRVQRSPDAKAAALYRERRLIPATAGVIRISGTLWREEGGKHTEFRLWIQQGEARPLPLRIDYQPKSYLRLSFEAET